MDPPQEGKLTKETVTKENIKDSRKTKKKNMIVFRPSIITLCVTLCMVLVLVIKHKGRKSNLYCSLCVCVCQSALILIIYIDLQWRLESGSDEHRGAVKKCAVKRVLGAGPCAAVAADSGFSLSHCLLCGYWQRPHEQRAAVGALFFTQPLSTHI
ncbi:hypothetical protein INR49_011480 [Caranx melampygus]|nr:hypothetical protein INR49_011480 [Caranx melampygus]